MKVKDLMERFKKRITRPKLGLYISNNGSLVSGLKCSMVND